MVSAKVPVVDHTPLVATLARRLVMEKIHVGSAWSRAKFDAATRVAVRSVMSLVFLASKTALGPVHIWARANYRVQSLVTCFHVRSAALQH